MSIRALTIGVILSVALNLAAPYAGLVMNSQFLDTSYFHIGLGIAFFVVLLGTNALLRLTRRPLALTEGELAVVFIMAAVAGTMPTHGTVGKLLSSISAPHYLASAENRWAEMFFPYLPRWAVVDAGQPLRWFYEGLPAGEAVPWAAWGMPVAWWAAFLGAAWFAGSCIIAILRRQWMDNERLAYPLAEMASAFIRGHDPAEPRLRFPRTRAFWVGFLLAFGTLTWNIVGYFTESWP